MKITFATTQIETICQESKRAVQKLGDLSAKKLHLRLAELFNAETVSELVAGHPHAGASLCTLIYKLKP